MRTEALMKGWRHWPWTLLLVGFCACGPEVPIFKYPGLPEGPSGPFPLNGRLLTTNNGDDTLSVVDPATQTVLGRVPVGFIPVELEGPHHLVADPEGRFVYVNLSEAVSGSGGGPHGAHGAGDVPGYALKLRTLDGGLEGFARVDPNPGDNVLSPDGRTLYVTHYDLLKLGQGLRVGDIRQADTRLAAIDTASLNVTHLVPMCPLAHGVRLSGDSKTLFATCGTDEIAVVGLEEPDLRVRRVALPRLREAFRCSRCPYALSVAPDDSVWVSSLGADSGVSGGGGLDVYSPSLGGFDSAKSLGLCGRALFAAFGPGPGGSADFRVYVPEQGPCGDAIRIYRPNGSGEAPTLEATLALPSGACLNAHMLQVAPDGKSAEVICEGNHLGQGSMVFLDLEARAVTKIVSLGVFPDGMVLVPARPQ